MEDTVENKIFETVKNRDEISLSDDEAIIIYILEPDGELSDIEYESNEEEAPDISNASVKGKGRKLNYELDSTQSEASPQEIDSLPDVLVTSQNVTPSALSRLGTPPNSTFEWKTKEYINPEVTWKSRFPNPPSETPTPIDYFKMMFNDSMIETLVYHTNLYCFQQTGTILALTVQEMETFIGINLLMGIVKMPTVYAYWDTVTRYPPIADVMGRDRFKSLRKFFHGNDNTYLLPKGHKDYDPLFKFRPILNMFRENIHKIPPEEHMVIDEQVIPLKGILSKKQYVKNKARSRGIKLFCRAGASGIIYDIEIYTGKANRCSKLGHGADVALRLSERIPQFKNFKLYCNHLNTSLPLFVELKNMGIYLTGRIESGMLTDCKLKEDAALKKMGRGSYDFKVDVKNDITITKWYDNKPVYVASTFLDALPAEKCKRWNSKSKQYDEITVPFSVAQYNEKTGGVELCNMLMDLYRIDNRGSKWYMRVYYYLFDISVVNAWLLYRRHAQQTQKHAQSLLNFKSDVANYLITGCRAMNTENESHKQKQSLVVKKKVHVKPFDSIRFDNINHWPEAVKEKQRCKNCQAYVRMRCSKCLIALCLLANRNCFLMFHSRDYASL